MSLRTAQEHLRVAHALGELPLVRARFSTGELSYSQVRAITRVVDGPAAEEFLVHYALHATGSHAREDGEGVPPQRAPRR